MEEGGKDKEGVEGFGKGEQGTEEQMEGRTRMGRWIVRGRNEERRWEMKKILLWN